jgi:hypothetical protein
VLINKEVFSTDGIVIVKRGKLITTGKYRNYKVMDGRYNK